MCETFGYQKLTATTKEKILGLNAARVYGIDIDEARRITANDDLAWARSLREDFLEHRIGDFLRT
jgi:hypothetical protein